MSIRITRYTSCFDFNFEKQDVCFGCTLIWEKCENVKMMQKGGWEEKIERLKNGCYRSNRTKCKQPFRPCCAQGTEVEKIYFQKLRNKYPNLIDNSVEVDLEIVDKFTRVNSSTCKCMQIKKPSNSSLSARV